MSSPPPSSPPPSSPSPSLIQEHQLWTAAEEGNLSLVKSLASDLAINVNWNGPEKSDTPLHRACRFGHLEVVQLLLTLSTIDVNAGNKGNASPFSIACQEGHLEIVKVLLADLRVDVNHLTRDDFTPFSMACQNGHLEVITLLLGDMRIDVRKPGADQCSPLWMASQFGHLPTVQLVLASGREVDTQIKSIAGSDLWHNKTAAEVAREGLNLWFDDDTEEEATRRKDKGPLIGGLLDSFDLDPVTTRHQLRQLPHIRDPFIGEVFALVVFLSDGLLTVGTTESLSLPPSPSPTPFHQAVRFFRIAQCLPMELQMTLCNRLFGGWKNLVLTKHSEPAFKKLGRLLAHK